ALARRYGATVAEEAKHKGNDVVYAPAVNILRTPQGGRSYEGFGEETFLVARTGVEWIRGAQSTGIIANIKHYLANNQEGLVGLPPFFAVDGSRLAVNVNVERRTLREVYMPQFEAAVKQGRVGTVMCAYNRVLGSYNCENPFTLVQVLRREWGFQGFVLSDYAASKDTAGNMNNGLDFVPAQGQLDFSYTPALIQLALATGMVERETLDEHVRNILRTLFAFGVFDRAAYAEDEEAIPVRRHARTAQDIEERAITLLKNSGVLPLDPRVRRIAVIGPYADRFVTGGGSGGVSPRSYVSALRAITDRAGPGVEVTYTDGLDRTAATAAASAADVAVVVTGDVQTEGQDKSCIGLNCSTDIENSNATLLSIGSSCLQQSCPLNGLDQNGLISAVAAAQPDTVVVLQTGGPVLTPWRSEVAALIEAWYPGQQGGRAIARVLFGDTDPGGRLPATFPASASQVPTYGQRSWYPGILEEVTYGEQLDVGYKWYDAHGFDPAYEFGAGLSYTSFSYGPLRLRPATGPNQVAVATMTVTNTGDRAGVAVPQLYLAKPGSADLPQPVRQLVGYASASIPAGGRVRVLFPLNARSFASWGADGWTVAPGCHRLSVGSSSRMLTSSALLSPGAGCERRHVEIGVRGGFDLPLPPMSRVVRLRRR
ncbi:MAG: hypothetical protein F2667_08915, partial [Actinobacteria bacterium]|nr:hypothetical protein [Actinomycetota bacterium]